MNRVAAVVAGGIAGILLAVAEAGWISQMFPLALAPIGGTGELLRAIAPRGVFVGAGAGGLVVLIITLVSHGARLLSRRRGREEQWLALIGTTLLLIALGALASALLRGPRARAAFGHPLLLVVISGAAAWCSYEILLLVCRARNTIMSRAGRWGLAGASLLVACGCYLVDHLVLVRLYEPFHLALRAGAFATLQIALLLAWSLAPAGPRVRRATTVFVGTAVVALALAMIAEAVGPTRAQTVAALNVIRLHGAVGGSMIAVGESLLVRGRARGVVRPVAVAADSAGAPRATEVFAPGANILLVTVDALRADHLEPYGYQRATSPNLSRLAAESIVFERAYTSAPYTSFAITSLLTGYPSMSLSNRGMLDGTPTLAELARANGYRTAAFYPPAVFFVDGERLKAFEDHAFGFEVTAAENLDEAASARIQTERVLSFLSERSPERFFIWVHYFAPHEPYVEHPEDGPAFGPRAVDRYDGEIRWVDRQIGRLVERVKDDYPYTIVAVTADHGEEFGEHGGAYHGTTLFDEQVRVPLILSMPGLEPARIRTPVSTIDLAPTLLGATGMRSGARFEGTDLTPWLDPRGVAGERELPPVFAENARMRMVASGDEKLVCEMRSDRCMLYDVVREPAELVDVSATRSGRLRSLRDTMEAWVTRDEGAPGRPDAWSALGDRNADPSVRRAAARTIARAPEAVRLPQLKAAWQGERDVTVAAFLAVALGELGDRDARASLPGLVDRAGEVDDDLRAHAALARARFAAVAPVAELAAALPRVSDVNLRCALMHALGMAGTPLSASTLIREYEPVRSRICCAEALATLHDPATLPFILDRIADEPYTIVQAALIRALGRIGDRRAITALQSLRASSPEADLVRAIDAVLADIDS